MCVCVVACSLCVVGGCLLLGVVCWLYVVVRRSRCVACWLLIEVCWLWRGVVRCLLRVACCCAVFLLCFLRGWLLVGC